MTVVVVVMPALPMRVMLLDPFRIVFVPPVAVVPAIVVVPIAVGVAPLGITGGPLRMMLPHPSGIMRMPPVNVMPFVMLVVVAPSVMLFSVSRARRHGRHNGDSRG